VRRQRLASQPQTPPLCEPADALVSDQRMSSVDDREPCNRVKRKVGELNAIARGCLCEATRLALHTALRVRARRVAFSAKARSVGAASRCRRHGPRGRRLPSPPRPSSRRRPPRGSAAASERRSADAGAGPCARSRIVSSSASLRLSGGTSGRGRVTEASAPRRMRARNAVPQSPAAPLFCPRQAPREPA
jgi:hypothetical protein